jgi:hypothetical protein
LQHYPHNDPLVIRANIGKNTKYYFGNDVGRVLVDNGSSADILTWQCFSGMGFKKEDLQKAEHPLYGFGNKRIEALGKIDVNVTFGQDATVRTEVITFDVVDFVYLYNAIFEHNTINKFTVVIHQGYLLMKIPTAAGVISVYGNQEEALRAERNTSVHNRQVHVIDEDEGSEVVPEAEQKAEAQMGQSMKQAEAERMKAVDDTRTVPLCADVPSRTIMIGTDVSKEEEDKLLQFLHHNHNVFAWSKSDLTGVHRSVIEHALNTDPKVKPKLQRQRPMSDDRVKSAEAEVQKLLDARIIREVQYPVWVDNVVMVVKKNGNMRMCIDFTELNKACPKDPYPLPRIDIIIDQAAGCEMLSLLDYFSGYHQVWMRKGDEAKTGFTTPFGIFCFVRMPEGLRNVGPTFDRMMKLILGSQLGRNASAYVDDIVIMSEKETDHIADLTETFNNMRRNGLKLNPEKWILGIRKGQLLGCMVSKWGIQANPRNLKRYAECSHQVAERRCKDLRAE